ncbi:class I SAM-dependent methyltransferase [Novosphingobium sp. Gsoil 351]|uniref:class I SAM-dependent methyltransferase n=1 Tax=Novosphingobium sp. Gsoil 351 TaxID=2675225 RepID=UPI0012B4874A|nr:methyltransferase domain-containing protein [Novosphingobium sp. Gsoil 351]QGN55714.1 methyltransferase domain-containing protein [Novosphingobium sp. Gsoil 351]
MKLDAKFVGSIPSLYEEHLVPVLFAPFAKDLVARAMALKSREVLEVAAGTGVVSHLLAEALPNARIVATDLNLAMLEVARSRGQFANLSFEEADAQSLPFDHRSFDLVLIQFGAMFFPDKMGAYAEARRVLVPGGTLLFNVWDRIDSNPGSAAIHKAVCDSVPAPKPEFLARTPFGYNDPELIESQLRASGFTTVTIERVEQISPPRSAEALARGMCLGSPLANELAAHSRSIQERALADATEAAKHAEGSGRLAMAALVVTAS